MDVTNEWGVDYGSITYDKVFVTTFDVSSFIIFNKAQLTTISTDSSWDKIDAIQNFETSNPTQTNAKKNSKGYLTLYSDGLDDDSKTIYASTKSSDLTTVQNGGGLYVMVNDSSLP